jgi:hypothetical protein
MSYFPARLSAAACLVGLSIAALSGCAIPDAGYSGYGAGLGVDYYEPAGFGYGGWGPGYGVAPFRGGDRRGGGFHGAHAYRAPAAGHQMPSIPGGGRPGGGGGRGGGGGGRR